MPSGGNKGYSGALPKADHLDKDDPRHANLSLEFHKPVV